MNLILVFPSLLLQEGRIFQPQEWTSKESYHKLSGEDGSLKAGKTGENYR